MPSRESASANQPKSFGREDYITEVVAAALAADADVGGTLVHSILRDLFEIKIEGSARVLTQTEYDSKGAGVSRIDMEVRTEQDVVFLENKTGAPIGLRADERTSGVIDQVAKYQRELDAAGASEARRHLAMLTYAPEPEPESDRYWRGDRRWWDLYRAVEAAPPTGSDYADRLRAEMLGFLSDVQLDPPAALRPANLDKPSTVQRVLAMAIEVAREVCKNPRPSAGPGYLFETRGEDGPDLSWSTGFAAGTFYARVASQGYRLASVPDDFHEMSVAEQVDALATVIGSLPATPIDPARAGGLSLEDFLAGFGGLSGMVEVALKAAYAAGWEVNIGSSEGNLRRVDRRGPQVYLSASYAAGPKVRVWCPDVASREAVLGILRELAPAAKATGESVAAPLAGMQPSALAQLVGKLGARATPAEDVSAVE